MTFRIVEMEVFRHSANRGPVREKAYVLFGNDGREICRSDEKLDMHRAIVQLNNLPRPQP